MRILVVDDNALNRELASFMLKDMGVQFKTVNSGQEALEILKTEIFEAVLMDVQMPVMDGRETTKRIRQLGMNVPIIALTAYSQEKEKKRCADAGMNAYLSKPFKEKDLFDVLEPFALDEIVLEKEGAVDVQHLKNIARDNQEFIDTVILRIAETLPEEIAALRKAVMEKNHERVNQLSHDMKTTFAVLGMTNGIQETLHYLESWTGNHRSEAKVLRMLQVVESAGAEATIQILENFSAHPGAN
jgi:CheY-like chemotaxis protein